VHGMSHYGKVRVYTVGHRDFLNDRQSYSFTLGKEIKTVVGKAFSKF
jgi:hypothetical protein